MIPVLTTERLVLTGHGLGDLPDCQAMWTDPEVVRHIGGKPFSPDQIWQRVLRYVGHWQLLGYGYWVAREKGTGRFVGEVGFANWMRDLQPAQGEAPELGYALAHWSHGRGLATEAVRAVTAWSDANGRGRTWCLISPEAGASLRVAQKCGYQEFGRTAYAGGPVVLLERFSGSR